jgi:pimeloyl-ACP methyl ester carboxylesterase
MSAMGMSDPAKSVFGEAMALRTMIALLEAGPDWCWSYHAIGATDATALARRVRCPVLLFAGPRDHNWRESQVAVADFADARFVAIPDAGVDAADEYPVEFCAIVASFLAGGRAPGVART